MIKTTLAIELVKNNNSIEMYLDSILYTTQRNKADMFAFLIQDYFFDLIKEVNLKTLTKIEWFDSNFHYYKEYKTGYNLYIQSDISFSELQNIFKSFKYFLKQINSNHYILECKRNLISVNSFVSPALYKNSHNEWFIIAGGVNIKVNRELHLFFDILYCQIKLKPTKIEEDENVYQNSKNYEDYLNADYLTDKDSEDNEKERPDIRIPLY